MIDKKTIENAKALIRAELQAHDDWLNNHTTTELRAMLESLTKELLASGNAPSGSLLWKDLTALIAKREREH